MRIKVRKVKKKDIEFLFELRNQPSTFQYSKNARPVGQQEHIDWITPILKGKTNKNLFVIEADRKRAGQVRLDIDEEKAMVNISLMPEFQGKGIGSIALQMAINKIARKKKVKSFLAEVHQENIASQKLFEKLGFVFQNQEGIWKTYVKRI